MLKQYQKDRMMIGSLMMVIPIKYIILDKIIFSYILDGNGYVEDGRDIFEDDLDYESISHANNKKGVKRKKKVITDNVTKGNLQYMLSNMPTKKKEVY